MRWKKVKYMHGIIRTAKNLCPIWKARQYMLWARFLPDFRGMKCFLKNFWTECLSFMVTDENSQYYGGFGNSETGEFYSFDNLMALKALALAEKP